MLGGMNTWKPGMESIILDASVRMLPEEIRV
jgi:hypothetical protein